MTPLHTFLAVIVGLIWGSNFIAIKFGLDEMSPILFSGLRQLVAALPILFIKKPNVSWSTLAGISFFQGTVAFPLGFMSVSYGLSCGIASLVMQTQVFFTLGLTMLLFGQRPSKQQLVGILCAFAGMGIIAWQSHGGDTLVGFLICLASAATWAVSNLFYQKVGKADILGVVVWASALSPLPLFLASFGIEGVETVTTSLNNISWVGIVCILIAACISTWVGSSIWGHLTRTYGAQTVAPYSLLVPVFGILSGWLFLGETLTALSILASTFIFTGLTIHHGFAPKTNPHTQKNGLKKAA